MTGHEVTPALNVRAIYPRVISPYSSAAGFAERNGHSKRQFFITCVRDIAEIRLLNERLVSLALGPYLGKSNTPNLPDFASGTFAELVFTHH